MFACTMDDMLLGIITWTWLRKVERYAWHRNGLNLAKNGPANACSHLRKAVMAFYTVKKPSSGCWPLPTPNISRSEVPNLRPRLGMSCHTPERRQTVSGKFKQDKLETTPVVATLFCGGVAPGESDLTTSRDQLG